MHQISCVLHLHHICWQTKICIWLWQTPVMDLISCWLAGRWLKHNIVKFKVFCQAICMCSAMQNFAICSKMQNWLSVCSTLLDTTEGELMIFQWHGRQWKCAWLRSSCFSVFQHLPWNSVFACFYIRCIDQCTKFADACELKKKGLIFFFCTSAKGHHCNTCGWHCWLLFVQLQCTILSHGCQRLAM